MVYIYKVSRWRNRRSFGGGGGLPALGPVYLRYKLCQPFLLLPALFSLYNYCIFFSFVYVPCAVQQQNTDAQVDEFLFGVLRPFFFWKISGFFFFFLFFFPHLCSFLAFVGLQGHFGDMDAVFDLDIFVLFFVFPSCSLKSIYVWYLRPGI